LSPIPLADRTADCDQFMMDLQRRPSGSLPPTGAARGLSDRNAAIFVRLVAENRLSRDIAVTCRGKNDGAGAQASRVVSGMLMARFAGCRYLHSPFVSMDHAEGAREDWAQRWERFLNFGDDETLVPEDAEMVSLSAAIGDPAAYAGRPIVVVERAFILPNDVPTEINESLRSDLRARYWRSPKTAIPSHRAATGFTVAIHLRRGDVNTALNSYRYIPDEIVLRNIARLRQALAPFGRPITLNLYSEGAVADFAAFADAGCTLHISEDPFETLHNMVTADILVGGNSSFSHLAALLSRGIVLDRRRRPPRCLDVLRRRADGTISIKLVRRALRNRMGWLERQLYRARHWWRLLSSTR
jgi:hypothetical protein